MSKVLSIIARCRRGTVAHVALRGVLPAIMIWAGMYPVAALAVPSYSRQTHQACDACHVGSFGPQLTPFGREFKLMGYTMLVGDDAKIPVSAMLVESYTHTRKAQAEAPADGFGRNNNDELQQASMFLAGRISDHLGIFAQATYEEASGNLGWDNIDLRYARAFTGDGHNGVWGVSLNNNPSVTDVFATAPAWQYPYMAPDLAPGAPAAPILAGGLGGQVIGANAYAQIDQALYLEAGGYRSLSPAFLRDVNADFDGRLSSTAPYLRAAYTWNLAQGNLELGGMALVAHRGLVGESASGQPAAAGGPSDRFRDWAVDSSYQYMAGSNTFTVNAQYVNEHQTLNGTFADGGAEFLHNRLQSLNVNASYWFANTWGATLAAFTNTGTSDALLYGDNANPDTKGEMIELDWTPLGKADSFAAPYVNLKLGVQYTFFNRFNGSVHNIDGTGRNASDNNTLYTFAWLAF